MTKYPVGDRLVKTQAHTPSSLATLAGQLPTTLALALQEYLHEAQPYLRLHALCSLLEITARFLTTVALADVIRQRPPTSPFPEPLITTFLAHLERPTLGSWRT